MRPIARLTERLAGASAPLLILPPLLLGAWAGVYIWDVFEFATAPGQPIVLEYEARGGTVRVRAESYAIDTRTGRVSARGLQLIGPDGKQVVRVQRLRIIPGEPNEAIKIEAEGVRGQVIRGKDGRFALAGLLPPPREEDAPPPSFKIAATDVRLTYLDLTDSRPLTMNLGTPELFASGVGDRWFVSTRVVQAGLGLVPLEVTVGPDMAYQVVASLDRNDVSGLLPAVQRLVPQPMPFRVRALVASGRLTVQGQGTSAAMVYGRMAASAEELSVNGRVLRRVEFQGPISGTRLAGAAVAEFEGGRARATSLAFDWSGAGRLVAQGELDVPRLTDVPRAWGVPRDVKAEGGQWSGLLQVEGNRWQADGVVRARQITVQGQRITNLEAALRATPQQVTAEVRRAGWQGEQARGAIQADLNRQRVKAFLEVSRADLGKIARPLGLRLEGAGRVQAVVQGPWANPDLWVSSSGSGLYRLPNDRVVSGRFSLRADGKRDDVRLRIARIRGPQGNVDAWGRVRGEQLDLQIVGSRLQASALADGTKGSGYFSGTLRGPMSNPTFSARADFYGVEFEGVQVPFVSGQITAGRDRVRLTGLQAQTGFTKVQGDVEVDLRSERLSGRFSAPEVQLAEVTAGEATGRIEVSQGRFSGTLKSPKIEGRIRGGPILAGGVELSAFEGDVRATNDLVELLNGRATLVEGEHQGTLANVEVSFNPTRQEGRGRGEWVGVPVSAFNIPDNRLVLDGVTHGEANLTWRAGSIEGEVAGRFENLIANGDAVGSGPFRATGDEAGWVASASLGDIERFVEAKDVRMTPDFSRGEGTFTVFNGSAANLVRIARPALADLPLEAQRVLNDLSASLNTVATFSWGGEGGLRAQAPRIEVGDIRLLGRAAGRLEASLGVQDGAATLASLLWQSGSGSLRLGQSEIGPNQLRVDGQIEGLDLSWLAAFDPTMPVIPARMHASFRVQGSGEKPEVEASGRLDAIVASDSPLANDPPTVDFTSVNLREDLIQAQGRFQASGFTGVVNASVPLASLQDGTSLFTVTASLDPRPIRDFRDVLSFLDLDRSRGVLGGTLTLSGTRQSTDIRGGLRFAPGAGSAESALAVQGLDTLLLNPDFQLLADGASLRFVAQGASSEGGTMRVEARTPLPSLPDFDIERVQEGVLAGSIQFRQFAVRQGAAPSLIAVVLDDTDLALSGTLRDPLISGLARIKGVDLDVPELGGEGEAFVPPIDARFAVDLVATGPVRIRTAGASLQAKAVGEVRGTLTAPRIGGSLTLERGTLRLPNARIALEEGGLIGLRFEGQRDGSTVVEAPVDLRGRTRVTTRRGATGYARYDVNLIVTGDLIATSGLEIRGESDPPGLSQQEILAFIGQRDLLEALATGAQDTQAPAFRDALIGLFLPSLTEGISTELASALGLDYLALEYTPFEGPVVGAGYSFDRFLSLEGRRAVGPPTPFASPRSELKLVYRLPSRSAVLSRARFILSHTNLVPWRLALEYSGRF